MKRFLFIVVIIIAAALAYLLAAPVSIDPVAWQPPTAPELTGSYQQNNKLSSTERISLGNGFAPEDVAIDTAGRLYAGFEDGRIIQVQPDGSGPREFAKTGGRPLGLAFDANG